MEDYRAPVEVQWSPYSWNGGTVLAVSGEDFSVIASDTRLSEGFQIYSRDFPKTYQLGDNVVLGSCGFQGDVTTLNKVIEAQLKIYDHIYQKKMSCESLAQLLSTILYTRRFFPYYTYNILAGLDSKGKGCVFSFDPIGSYEREVYRAGGSASSMLQPLLDNQIGLLNQTGVEKKPLSVEKAVQLVTDVFTSAAERDIYTGDGIRINIISADGVDIKEVPLRRD
ncbi:PREDICTED: proteasome subunit beta type-1-B-like [Amphimedon queenslandica]|uniref:Proteasome subunit beta n=1 Tax=Amphimedon queenslandica TaxID=400682 RepID=A0A1X7V344_AMPQE|nr:PREDICTED: proteasome subunit beta type-1-B-like [Amphimedon queenslandica]|eukprot:XP_003385953.1 PREDICTED: proteasome subunit beta type-1-B-like [Amphimedon queenslandica]